MLRITIQAQSQNPTIKLEGKLVGPWVEELRRSWQSLASSVGTRKLCLDLRGVSYVDTRGQQLLRKICEQADTTFVTDSPLTEYFADSAKRPKVKSTDEGA